MILVRQGSANEIEILLQKIPEFLNPYKLDLLKSRLTESSLIFIAEIDGQVAGFKCGYPLDGSKSVFYSWLGGVLKEFRMKGVALALLKKMEARCFQSGFQWLTFKTLNQHKMMIFFALKNGFEIDQVINSEKDNRKRIIFKKRLLDGKI